MTNLECRPPAGTENGTWHWVLGSAPEIALWSENGWYLTGIESRLAPDERRMKVFCYLGLVEPWREGAVFLKAANGLEEGIQVAALHAAMAEASDYEADAHALSHTREVLDDLRRGGWKIAREGD